MKRLIVSLAFASVLAACSNPLASAPGDGGGDAIDVFGPYRGVEADNFAASLRGFEDATGIDVTYTGSADFVSDLRQRIESGLDAPDIAVVPQPGVIAEIIDRDLAVPLADGTVAAIAEHYGERAANLTMGSEGYAAPYRVSAKSLVWYRPDVFDEYGWAVPTTLDELIGLVEEIQGAETGSASPIAPWCFSMASGTATGWAATDWVEDLVIRQAGTEAYDQWTADELAWDDPAIRAALTSFDDARGGERTDRWWSAQHPAGRRHARRRTAVPDAGRVRDVQAGEFRRIMVPRRGRGRRRGRLLRAARDRTGRRCADARGRRRAGPVQ